MCLYNVATDQFEPMLAASQCGARTPLSPLAQAALEKHLPGFPAKRLLQHSQKAPVQKSDVACLTDICNGEEIPEVEIFSLLEEKIPKYRVRADTLTQFGGYSNQDWFIPTPALPIPPEGLGLTKDQVRETLNYFRSDGDDLVEEVLNNLYEDLNSAPRSRFGNILSNQVCVA